MTDPTIDNVFALLDKWRHLPEYQLERRADIYFALFLPIVLEEHFKAEFHSIVIPEFPLRHGTLGTNTESIGPNLSVNVDYTAFAKNLRRIFLVELKTNIKSRTTKQDDYLRKATEFEFKALVDGVLTISQVTPQPKKYVHLIHILSNLGLVRVPKDVYLKASQEGPNGLRKALRGVENKVVSGLKPEIIYIQPNCTPEEGTGSANCIDFQEIARILKGRGEIANRFALSLLEWAKVDAGSAPSGTVPPIISRSW